MSITEQDMHQEITSKIVQEDDDIYENLQIKQIKAETM